MVQTIVIARQVVVPGRDGCRPGEEKHCFPDPLPNEEAKREVAELLLQGDFCIRDDTGRDITKSAVASRLIAAVKPYLNGAAAMVAKSATT